tara:strand:- start:2734 stop:3291 length:558 start_codon:yes stop_codon:yes gene_type:complete
MNDVKKLHLGCGERYLSGYIHVDINKLDNVDIVTSVDNLAMFEDDSIDEIYSSHVLEYFDKFESLEVLSEWRRVLKKNGILRLAVPNFSSLVEVYNSTNNIDNVIGPIVGRWEINKAEKIYHKQIFDFKSLKNQLEHVGYRDVDYWEWKDFISNYPDYDDHSQAYFPHMDKENGIHVSLNVICIK